ncbi:MAG: hypothetical protein IKY10_01935 [Clostridia bacterium]|nr:hypothetical protein [Clostridia bacterium]
MKYFGTDGIRGEIKKDLNNIIIDKVAHAIVLYYNKHKLKRILLVGNDTRISSGYILARLETKLLQNGIEVHNINQCSSPCLAFLTQKFNYPLGLMLSASHNPAEYNGLKFFNSFGEKVSDEFEQEFELLMDKKTKLKNNIFTVEKNKDFLINEYVNHLKSYINFNFPAIFDCSNGGVTEICKKLLPKQQKINISPNGTNINLNAGCTHLETLKSLCIKQQKIGFAFDGDGDRVHIVNFNGDVITGDKILFILSKFFQNPHDICVGTIYTNTGLEKCLNKRKIALKRSDVGDKNVYKLMKIENSSIGGEDSGHIIYKPLMNTGDGLLIAITVANILSLSNLSLTEILKGYEENFQYRKDLKIKDKNIVTQILENQDIKNTISYIEKQQAKVVVRLSGTEPLIRLFIEHKDEEIAKELMQKLCSEINSIIS